MSEYNLADMLYRIKILKKDNKISNERLSEITGISLGTLSKILAGQTKEASVETIIKIANGLNSCAEYLIFGDEPSLTNPTLSDTEKSFIADFRALSDQGKEFMIDVMDMAKEKYKKDILSAETDNVG